MELDIIKTEILNLDGIPDKASAALALRAFGFGSTKIGRMLETPVKTIESYFRRYDSGGLCKVTSEQKRLITSEMLTGTGNSALLEITDEKLQKTNAKDLAMIATRCINAAEKSRPMEKVDDRMAPSRIKSMMDSLDCPQYPIDNG